MDLREQEYFDYIKGLECDPVKEHFAIRLNEGSKMFKEIKTMFAATDTNIKDLRADVKKIQNEFTPEANYKRWKQNMLNHRKEQGNAIIWIGKVFEVLKSIAVVGILIWIFFKDVIEAIIK